MGAPAFVPPPPLADLAARPEVAAILEGLEAAICLLDAAGRLLTCNARWLDAWQAIAGEALGAGADLVAGFERAAAADGRELAPLAAELRALLDGRRPRLELEFERPGRAGTRWMRLAGTPVRLGGRVAGAVLTQTDVTSSRRASEAAAVSESRYRAVLEAMADGLILVDAEGRIADMNPAAARLLGTSRDEELGRPIFCGRWTLLGVEGTPAAEASLPALLELCTAGGLRGLPIRLLRRDGAERRLEASAEPLFLDAGERPSHVVVSLHDVTEQQRAEEIRRAMAEVDRQIIGRLDLATILETVCRGVVGLGLELAWIGFVQPDGRTEIAYRAGPAAAYLDGIEIRFDESPAGRGPVGKAIRTGRPVVMGTSTDPDFAPWRERAARAGLRSCLAIPLAASGRSEGVLAAYSSRAGAFDPALVEQLTLLAGRAAVAVHAARTFERLRRVTEAIEQADEAVVICDRDGTIRYVNPAFTRTSGYPAAEAIGKTPRILKSGRHEEGFYRDLWVTLTGGRTWKGKFVNRRKDGSLYTAAQTIAPVRDEAGRIAGFVSLSRDVSREIEVEARLAESEKIEAVGRLAGGIAHDFSNALSGVLGFADLAIEKLRPEDPTYESLVEIRRAAKRAAGIARQLLIFSRKQLMEFHPTDLDAVVEGIASMLRRVIGEDVRLLTDLGASPAVIEADAGQIEQLIVNLAINARDAMPRGGRLAIRTERAVDADGGRVIRLTVADTGCGMTPEVKAHLFEPFFTTKPKGKGTGLGLAVVHGIVGQHRGRIAVASEPGEGTTFRIEFPEATSSRAARKNAGDEAAALPRIDDDETVRTVVARHLERLGYTAVTAASGYEAIGIAAKRPGPIDLVICDLVMPGMDGREAAEEVVAARPGARVLFLSGYPADVLDGGGRWAGARPLQKPVTLASLAVRVREELDAGGRANALPAA
jgi:PAS domain S-box-containing protein